MGALATASAAAAEPARRFDIPAKPYADALIDLALQGDVSLLGASACRGTSPALRGRYTVPQALARLLDKAPCRWRMLDARTVRILPPAAAAAPARHETMTPLTLPPLVSEVMVTADRRRQPAARTAAAVTVIGADELQAVSAEDPTATVGLAAGLAATNLGPGRDKLLVRGLSDGAFTGRARSTVGTYLDDAPINYDAPDPDLRLVDVARVEVVRGPQGALYGSGSLTGVYRIVTRKPDLTGFHAAAQASYAWTEGGSPSHSVDLTLNAPVLRDVLGLRVSGYREVDGGYLDDINLRRSNVDKTLREGGRAALRAQLGDDWTVDLSATRQHLRSDDAQYVNATLGGPRRANRAAESHDNNFLETALTVHGALGWANLTSTTAYVRHSFHSEYDASNALDQFDVAGPDVGVYTEAARIKMLVEDLLLTSAGHGRFSWLAGVYVGRTVEDTPSMLGVAHTPVQLAMAYASRTPLAAIYDETRRDRLAEAAAYGEVSYEVLPGWTASAGGRLFETWRRTSSTVERTAPIPPRQLERDARYDCLSPKLSLQHELRSGDLLYALVSEGFRPGGINTGGLGPPQGRIASFSPDRLRNYEVGGKFARLGGRLALRTALFYDLWRNLQTDQYLFPSGLPYTANVGDARTAGIETELAYAFAWGLSVEANATLSTSKVIRLNPGFVSRLAPGLPGAPDASGGVLAIYERPLRRALALRLIGSAAYVGRSYLTFNAANAPAMGDYVKARLSAQLVGRGWTADLSVSNPANDAGDTFAYGNPFSFGQVRQVTPQRPRTVSVTVAATY